MLDSYQDLIEELTATPGLLRGALDELGGSVPPEVVALIAELRDRDLTVLERLQLMLRQRDPILKALPARSSGRASTAEAEATLAGFNAARGEVISLLMNLTLRDWERTAIDAGGAQIALDEEVERHVEFDEDHVERIRIALGG